MGRLDGPTEYVSQTLTAMNSDPEAETRNSTLETRNLNTKPLTGPLYLGCEKRALPTATEVESGTSQSKSGFSVNFRNGGEGDLVFRSES